MPAGLISYLFSEQWSGNSTEELGKDQLCSQTLTHMKFGRANTPQFKTEAGEAMFLQDNQVSIKASNGRQSRDVEGLVHHEMAVQRRQQKDMRKKGAAGE